MALLADLLEKQRQVLMLSTLVLCKAVMEMALVEDKFEAAVVLAMLFFSYTYNHILYACILCIVQSPNPN